MCVCVCVCVCVSHARFTGTCVRVALDSITPMSPLMYGVTLSLEDLALESYIQVRYIVYCYPDMYTACVCTTPCVRVYVCY